MCHHHHHHHHHHHQEEVVCQYYISVSDFTPQNEINALMDVLIHSIIKDITCIAL
jgi:hypothetical protein